MSSREAWSPVRSLVPVRKQDQLGDGGRNVFNSVNRVYPMTGSARRCRAIANPRPFDSKIHIPWTLPDYVQTFAMAR